MKTLRTPHSDLAHADALLDEALRETFPASDAMHARWRPRRARRGHAGRRDEQTVRL